MNHKRGDLLIKSHRAIDGEYFKWIVKVVAFSGRGKKKLWVKHFADSGNIAIPLQLTLINPKEFRKATDAEVAHAITRIISK